jgi:hypothetical protein
MNNRPLRIQVMGGLGNQLHGLAAGIAIAGSQGRSLIVDTSRVSFGSNLSRLPELQHLQLKGCEVDVKFDMSHVSKIQTWHEKLSRASNGRLKTMARFSEPDFVDNFESPLTQLAQMSNDTESVGGPFIDFDWVEISQKFGFPAECFPRNPSQKYLKEFSLIKNNSLAMHIRLGDYLTLSHIFPIATERYYQKALEAVNYEISQEISVFTDSPGVLRSNYPSLFDLGNLRVIDTKISALETLSLMSKFPIVIGSNSTFSSWAGWFSGTKKMVTPIPHHLNEWSDRLPKHWERISIN